MNPTSDLRRSFSRGKRAPDLGCLGEEVAHCRSVACQRTESDGFKGSTSIRRPLVRTRSRRRSRGLCVFSDRDEREMRAPGAEAQVEIDSSAWSSRDERIRVSVGSFPGPSSPRFDPRRPARSGASTRVHALD